MFPGPHVTIYRNEVGEVLGWSDESYYEPDYEEQERDWDARHCDCGVDLKFSPCRCDIYCSRCGETTLDPENDFMCGNIFCLDNLELMFPVRIGS